MIAAAVAWLNTWSGRSRGASARARSSTVVGGESRSGCRGTGGRGPARRVGRARRLGAGRRGRGTRRPAAPTGVGRRAVISTCVAPSRSSTEVSRASCVDGCGRYCPVEGRRPPPSGRNSGSLPRTAAVFRPLAWPARPQVWDRRSGLLPEARLRGGARGEQASGRAGDMSGCAAGHPGISPARARQPCAPSSTPLRARYPALPRAASRAPASGPPPPPRPAPRRPTARPTPPHRAPTAAPTGTRRAPHARGGLQ